MSDFVEVVINVRYGGFGLSNEAKNLYKERSNGVLHEGIRHDLVLVQIVKELGTDANDKFSELSIEKIPVEFKNCYVINEYDGMESIDLSPELLVKYKLSNMDVDNLSLEECKTVLEEYKKIISTCYYIFDE